MPTCYWNAHASYTDTYQCIVNQWCYYKFSYLFDLFGRSFISINHRGDIEHIEFLYEWNIYNTNKYSQQQLAVLYTTVILVTAQRFRKLINIYVTGFFVCFFFLKSLIVIKISCLSLGVYFQRTFNMQKFNM